MYSETGNAKVDFFHIANKIARKVKAIYDSNSIPTVTEYRTIQLIITYNDICRKLRKSSNRKINKSGFSQNVREFKSQSLPLFDKAACKYLIDCVCEKLNDLCEHLVSTTYNYEKAKIIPPFELKFLYSGRNVVKER